MLEEVPHVYLIELLAPQPSPRSTTTMENKGIVKRQIDVIIACLKLTARN